MSAYQTVNPSPLWLVACALLMSACSLTEPDDSLIAREVIVAPKQHVTPEFARAQVARRGLNIKHEYFPETFLVRIAVEAGDVAEHVASLERSPIVRSIVVWGSLEIRLNVVSEASEAEAQALVSDRAGLRFASIIRFQSLIVVEVPQGREDAWVRRFNRESWVAFAERNQLVSPRGRGGERGRQ